MRVDAMAVVPIDDRDACWSLYYEAFASTRTLAVQRHLMHRHEFDEVMADERVTKYLARTREGELAGMGSATPHLDAMPLIDPAYFAARWPRLYDERRIYYVGFVATHPGRRMGPTLGRLVRRFAHDVAEVDGVVVLDVSRNRAARRLPEVVLTYFRQVAGDAVELTTLDEQIYVAYDFSPAAGESAGSRTISLVDAPLAVVSAGDTRVSLEGGSGLP